MSVGDEQIRLLREALDKAHFRDMPGSFGESEDQMRMVRRVNVVDGDFSKEVYQVLDEEDESEALAALVDRFFEVLEPLATDGKGATDLKDGLAKVASGDLAPEALHLVVHYKPKAANPSRPGFLFRVEDGRATFQPYGEKGYGQAVEVPLERSRLKAIADALVAADPSALPANLYAPEYSEVLVQVLNHRKALLARQFAGMKPDALGDKQRRFDTLFESLRAVADPAGKTVHH